MERDHVLEIAPLALELALRVAQDDVVARPPGDLFDAADDESEERIGDIGDDHAERVRLPLDQAAREPARDVAEFRDRGLYALAGGVADARALVDDARNSHRRDAGVDRHVVDRRSHRLVTSRHVAG
jgi:hypothetical protein